MRCLSYRFCLIAATLLACSSESTDNQTGPDGGDVDAPGDGSDTPPTPYDTLTFAPEDIAVATTSAAPGYQNVLRRDPIDGTMFVAFLKNTNNQQATCDIADFGGDEAPGVNYTLEVARKSPGENAWTQETVPLDQLNVGVNYITARYGLDGTFDANGDFVLAFAGGSAGLFSCGSGDLVLATRARTTGQWTVTVAVADSTGCCTECAAAGCTNGTDVGPWASVAVDNSNQLAVVFMDYHNNVTQLGQDDRGLEIWQPGGGDPMGIQPFSGKGAYSDLIYVNDASYSGPVVAYTQRKGGGLFISRWINNVWEEQVLLPAGWLIGERLSIARASNGTLGLAGHIVEAPDKTDPVNDLRYFFSNDHGATWASESVDLAVLNLGAFPSLAFDSQNRPAIAYYLCGSGVCDNNTDGVRFAVREVTGRWWTFDVHSNSLTTSGAFNQLLFDPTTGAPQIVFQDFGVSNGLDRGAVMLARGQFSP